MTILSHLIHFFPLALMALAGLETWNFVATPTLGNLLGIFFVLYGLPLLAYRIHNHYLPIREGIEVISEPGRYCRWWGTFQIQAIYHVLPQLEWALRPVPGLYSFWLRLWGSRIGKGVYWTPNIEVLDRGLVEVGDYAIFGHEAKLISHVVSPKRGRLIVFVKKIRIGNRAFVGAFSGMGPGSELPDEGILPAMGRLQVNETGEVP